MKVLNLSFLVPEATALNGAGQVIHGQTEILRQNNDLHLVVLSPSSQSQRRGIRRLREAGISVHVVREWLPTWLVAGKRYWSNRISRAESTTPAEPPTFDPHIAMVLQGIAAQESFDVLQVENIGLGKPPTIPGLPTLLVEHEVCPPRRGEDYQAAIWKQSDLVQVFTPRDAHEIEKRAPSVAERIRVNPFGIAIEDDIPAYDATRRELVFIGNYNHAPNVVAARVLANEVLPAVHEQLGDIRLTFVGNAPPPEVTQLASPSVTVTGRVPNINEYLDRAALVVAPIQTGGGMRVKTLQAMARAKPVVTTPLGAEGLYQADGPPPLEIADDAEAMAKAIVGLMNAPEKRAKLGGDARAFVARYHSWDAYRDRIEAMYAELTHTAKAR